MKKNAIYSTKVQKGPLIFTIIGLLSSIVVITLCAVLGQGHALAITAMVFFGIILLSAIALLFGELLDYAYVTDEYLVSVFIFKKTQIKFSDIDHMKLEKDIYIVYDKKKNKVCTINAVALGIEKVVLYLDKKGVKLT